MPDLQAFAAKLAENDVDGKVLLGSVDDAFLKEECELRKLGARHPIKACIQRLQKCSTQFCVENEKAPPTQEAMSRLSSIVAPESTEKLPERVKDHEQKHAEGLHHIKEETATIAKAAFPSPPQPNFFLTTEAVRKHARAVEEIVEDLHGKKRRRITLPQFTLATETAASPQAATLSTTVSPPAAITPSAAAAPLPAQSQPAASTPASTTTQQQSFQRGYLGTSALHVDEIFYGSTKLGQAIQDFLSPQGMRAEGGEDDFQFMQPLRNAGDSQYVYKQLLHSWTSNNKTDVNGRGGRVAVAVQPYRETLLADARAYPSSTVFQFLGNDNTISAMRENAAFIESGHAMATDTEQPGPSAEEWGFLREKYQGSGDTVLRAWSESEGDIDSSLAAEIEKEKTDIAARQVKTLCTERVSELFEDYVQACIDRWKEKHLARLEEKKAWTVWKKGKTGAIREDLIKGCCNLIERLDGRLTNIKADILRNEWNEDRQVMEMCITTEATVEDREKERWEMSVLERTQEPEHTKAPPRAAKANRRSMSAKQFYIPERGLPSDRTSSAAALPAAAENDDRMELDDAIPANDDRDGHDEESDQSMQDEVKNDFVVADDASTTPGAAVSIPKDRYVQADSDSSGEIFFDACTHTHPSSGRSEQEAIDLITPTALNYATPKEGSTQKGSVSGSPDELPSPSQFAPNYVKSEKKIERRLNFVDLTSNPSTPAKDTPVDMLSMSFEKQLEYCKPIEQTPIEVLNTWTYEMLIGAREWDRILLKALSEHDPEFRDELYKCIQDASQFEDQLSCAVESYVANNLQPESLDLDSHGIMMVCARIYEAWNQHREPRWDGLFTDALLPPTNLVSGTPLAKKWEKTRYATVPTFDWGKFNSFHKLLELFLSRKDTNLFLSEGDTRLFRNRTKELSPITIASDYDSEEEEVFQADSDLGNAQDTIDVSDDSETDDASTDVEKQKMTPAKQRKRLVKKTARRKVANALARQEKWVAAKESQGESQFARREPTSEADDELSVVVNPMEDARAQHIVYPQLAKALKPHQIDGLRSMWREITADADEDESQGCVLAHTMGLGKTLQAVALLVVLMEAASSDNKRIVKTLPKHLRLREGDPPRMMVLCPPNIITNWLREIEQWGFGKLKSVVAVESGQSPSVSLDQLETWYHRGGLLVIGHSLFRGLLSEKAVGKKDRPPRFDRETVDRIEVLLLEGPDIVIMDEAQAIKNGTAALTTFAHSLKTPSRVALTGTPMSNNLGEAYALVSWVAPGYLGDEPDFRSRYQTPIERAGYADASNKEIRTGNKKLHVLWHQIAPKVNRADITVMKGSLKPKVEFLVTVPLTEAQTGAYQKFVRVLLEGRRNTKEKLSQVTLFSWLATLTLLTNHPFAYRKKLLTPRNDGKAKKDKGKAVEKPAESAAAAAVGGLVGPDDEDKIFDSDLYTLGFSEEAIRALLEDLTPSLAENLSVKTALVMQILRAAKVINDKVLVFSQSIPCLDYFEKLFVEKTINYARIDGGVNIQERGKILEQFQEKKYDVMLVSTRAGGVGLNIQTANRVIIMDSGFNPAWEEQAIGRAYRMGQQKPVFVYRLVTGGTFETKLYDQQIYKSSLSKKVVDKMNPERHTMREAGQWLFEPQEVMQKDIYPKNLGLDPQVMDRLLQKDDCQIRALDTFETLQAEAKDPPLTEEEQKEVQEEIALTRMGKTKRLVPGGATAPGPSTGVPSIIPANLAEAAFMADPAGMPGRVAALAGLTSLTTNTAGGSSSTAMRTMNGLPHAPASPASTMPTTSINGLPSVNLGRSATRAPDPPSFPKDDDVMDVDQDGDDDEQQAVHSSPVARVSEVGGEDHEEELSEDGDKGSGGKDGRDNGEPYRQQTPQEDSGEDGGEDEVSAEKERAEAASPSAGRGRGKGSRKNNTSVWKFWN